MKKLRFLLTLLFWAIGPLCPQAQHEPAALSLSPPHHQASFQVLKQVGFQYWDKGHLIAWGIGGPPLTLYDREGNCVREATVWFDEAVRVSIADAAVGPAGSLLVSGGASVPDGSVFSFIAEIDAAGHVGRVVRTTPYIPRRICAADDGTVWSYGGHRDPTRGAKDFMLRQYSFEKGQLKVMLDRASLNSNDWDISAQILRCTSGKVRLLNWKSNQLIEFDIQANALKEISITPLPNQVEARMTAFAASETGDLYASVVTRPRNGDLLAMGVYKLSLDGGGKGAWVPLANSIGRRGVGVEELLGVDGTALVYRRKLDGVAYWSRLAQR